MRCFPKGVSVAFQDRKLFSLTPVPSLSGGPARIAKGETGKGLFLSPYQGVPREGDLTNR